MRFVRLSVVAKVNESLLLGIAQPPSTLQELLSLVGALVGLFHTTSRIALVLLNGLHGKLIVHVHTGWHSEKASVQCMQRLANRHGYNQY